MGQLAVQSYTIYFSRLTHKINRIFISIDKIIISQYIIKYEHFQYYK